MTRRRGLLLAAAGLILAVGLADGLWLEPRVLLFRDDVRIRLEAPPLRIVHLSDLHIGGDRPLLHRLLQEAADAKPDLIVITGDFVQDTPSKGAMAGRLTAVSAFLSTLRRTAPIVGVQGHSEHQGDVINALDRSGVELLSNEGRRIDHGGSVLLLGLNQQVGEDVGGLRWQSPFQVVRWNGQTVWGAVRERPFRNFYSHWDPAPLSLTDTSGPFVWSGYEVVCDTLIDDLNAGTGIVVHSRFVLGEDRMYSLTYGSGRGMLGTFSLWARGTEVEGGAKLDTHVTPRPGHWYRMRLRVEVTPESVGGVGGGGVVRLLAKVWPVDGPEPQEWQARGEDRSTHRVQAGTAGLWTWGGGTVGYRNFKVMGLDGSLLVDAPMTGAQRPEGFREGTRGTRLALALARSPWAPPGTPTVVLSHTPAVALEAAQRGLEVVLAGHTHGGQIRLPLLGALTTRDALGPYYDEGRFQFPSPSLRGLTTLYINAGVGTSVLPIRFFCPPRFAVIELGRERGSDR